MKFTRTSSIWRIVTVEEFGRRWWMWRSVECRMKAIASIQIRCFLITPQNPLLLNSHLMNLLINSIQLTVNMQLIVYQLIFQRSSSSHVKQYQLTQIWQESLIIVNVRGGFPSGPSNDHPLCFDLKDHMRPTTVLNVETFYNLNLLKKFHVVNEIMIFRYTRNSFKRVAIKSLGTPGTVES